MAKRSIKREVVVEETLPLDLLQAIINKAADTRLDEIEADMMESGVVEEGERYEKGSDIYRLFKLWKKVITRIEIGEPDYFRLKEMINDIFSENEVDYWMHGEKRYLQKITWLILKHEGFCEEYKIRKRNALGLMEKCGWNYIIKNHNPKDGWVLESDRQSEKFREQSPEQFKK